MSTIVQRIERKADSTFSKQCRTLGQPIERISKIVNDMRQVARPVSANGSSTNVNETLVSEQIAPLLFSQRVLPSSSVALRPRTLQLCPANVLRPLSPTLDRGNNCETDEGTVNTVLSLDTGDRQPILERDKLHAVARYA